MINVFLDGFSAFQNHFWIIVCLLLPWLWGWMCIRVILEYFFSKQFTNAEIFSLASAGAIFPAMIWAGMFFIVNILFSKTFAGVCSLIIFIIPFLFIKLKKFSATTFILFLSFLVSLILRLAFLERATLPSYFDSVEHYRTIKFFLDVSHNNIFAGNVLSFAYYHVGYHILISAIISLFNISIVTAMLILGQIVLAILPLPFFFIIKQETNSTLVAFFACFIAGFGLHMPAHVVNWGKYPALLSLFGIQLAFILGYLILKNGLKVLQKAKLSWVIFFLLLLTTLIHSRALIVALGLIVSIFLSLWQKKQSTRIQYISVIAIILIFVFEIFYIQQSPALLPLITGYAQRDLWFLFLALFLSFFAIKYFPVSTFFSFASISLFVSLLFLPIPLFNYGIQTLLDRPFVQMLSYIPLSIIVSLGLSGLLQMVRNIPIIKIIFSFAVFGFMFLYIFRNYSFYPSTCCQLASADDLAAIEWINTHLPLDAQILIASNPLYVNPFETNQSQVGVDAGIWINPLTSRSTLLAPAEMNFELTDTFSYLCSQAIEYIYLGSMPQRFNQQWIASHPEWYYPLLLLPKVQIYQVNCQ